MKPLNPLIHSQLRLAIMSILMNVESADFVYLQEKTASTSGNLSRQIEMLKDAGYIEAERQFVNKKPPAPMISIHRSGMPDLMLLKVIFRLILLQ